MIQSGESPKLLEKEGCFLYSRVMLLLIILLGLGSPAPGQSTSGLDPQKALTQYNLDVWRTDDGLPNNAILRITQTTDGYLWMGTFNGLVRFDGVRFHVFNTGNTDTLKSNTQWCLFESRDGSLWIGTNGGGLTRHRNGVFTTYTQQDGLAGNFVFSVCEDTGGSLWIGTSGGLSRLTNGQFSSFNSDDGLSDDHIWVVCFDDGDESLWIGTKRGLCRWKNGEFISYAHESTIGTISVLSLALDSKNSLWIGTQGNGLVRFQDGKFRAYSSEDGFHSKNIWSLCEDGLGSLWIGTDHKLWRYRNGKFSSLSTEEGLSRKGVGAFCSDREGSLWIGSYGDGLNRLRDGKFLTYTTMEGLVDDTVYSIFEDKEGAFWISTYKGISRLKNGRFTNFTRKDGLPDDFVRFICGSVDGGLWIATFYGGLTKFKNGVFTTYTAADGLPCDNVRCVVEEKNGALWIGTDKGLCRFKDGEFSGFPGNDEISRIPVLSLRKSPDGGVWICTDGSGVIRYRDKTFTTTNQENGLASDLVFFAYEDEDQTAWIGTDGGLCRLKDGKVTIYRTRDGLFSDSVFHILEDQQGRLWMGCNNGIFYVSKKELLDLATGKIDRVASKSFGQADGLKTNEVNVPAAPCVSRDGLFWIPTKKGIAVVDPANIKRNMLPPPVIVEDLLTDGGNADMNNNIFPPGTKRFGFYYTALSFIAPEKVRFKVKLEGFDEDWIDVGSKRTDYYTNLSPGTYTFHVTACNNDNVWNTTGAAMTFRLKPHFYETSLFYFLAAVATLCTAFGVYRLRVRQLRGKQKELERVVAARTREITEQKKVIEQKNVSLTASIRYAKRIQQAMLPMAKKIESSFPEHFIIYKPKQIVSGDFYWFVETGGHTFLAVVDCTGHGVPGAFMSIIGNTLLKEIIIEKRISDPAMILMHLHQGVRKELQQEEPSKDQPADGMDVCLCRLENGGKRVTFAGSRRPLYLFQYTDENNPALVQIKGDRKSIGGRQKEDRREFTNHTITPGGQTVIYLSTDGFVDQQNGEGKRYGSQRFRDYLGSIAHLPIHEQESRLLKELENHQGNEEQRDDITLVGVNLSSGRF